jgi:hypothetical protein
MRVRIRRFSSVELENIQQSEKRRTWPACWPPPPPGKDEMQALPCHAGAHYFLSLPHAGTFSLRAVSDFPRQRAATEIHRHLAEFLGPHGSPFHPDERSASLLNLQSCGHMCALSRAGLYGRAYGSADLLLPIVQSPISGREIPSANMLRTGGTGPSGALGGLELIFARTTCTSLCVRLLRSDPRYRVSLQSGPGRFPPS